MNKYKELKQRAVKMIFRIIGTAFILYYLILAAYAGPTFSFGIFWPLMGSGFLLASFQDRFSTKTGRILTGRILPAFLIGAILLILLMSINIIRVMPGTNPDSLPCIIVLGAQVKGDQPSRALLRRLERAEEAANKNPDLILILSGGQGDNEDISEAECMWNYLTEKGISPDRLIKEDKSTNTWENLTFSDRLTGCAKESCGIISNDFHLYRAGLIAKKAGYKDPRMIAAKGDPVMEIHYIIRETAALIKAKINGTI